MALPLPHDTLDLLRDDADQIRLDALRCARRRFLAAEAEWRAAREHLRWLLEEA
jgi:hypothetical protein